ncbi:MAG: hypothetical protein B7733_13905 [Myxococcales bacterium FL481]|nr:MAG: hypothetical protein B7733_13905 [Myxococcales bacterium FL481]
MIARVRMGAVFGAMSFVTACQGAPAVEVSTYTVKPTVDSDQQGNRRPDEAEVHRRGPLDPVPAPSFTPEPPENPDQFAALLSAVRHDAWEQIGLAARNLARADPGVWDVVKVELVRDREARKSDYRTVLDTIGGDVPNRYGHFARAWKKAHGYSVRLSEDWFEDLLALPSEKISSPMLAVYRDCVLQAALLRAASHVATADPSRAGDVVETLLDAAYIHHGTFRDEVGRAIVAIGTKAVPALVRASAKRGAEEASVRRRAEYALFNLDRLDQRDPQRALTRARPELGRYLELIDAYGMARLPQAAPALLALTDDPVARVREQARTAFLAFVVGDVGTTEQRTLRLLGGETTTRALLAAHRNVAAAAILDQLADAAPDLVEPRCSRYHRSGARDRHCEAQPERHTRAYFGWLDDQRRQRDAQALAAALNTKDPELAVQQLDALLASGTAPPEPAAVVETFVARAQSERDQGDPLRAAALLRKSAMLLRSDDPGLARRLRASALRLEAEAPDLPPSGRAMLLAAAGIADEPASASPDRVRPRSFFPMFASLLAVLACVTVLGGVAASPRRRARPQ